MFPRDLKSAYIAMGTDSKNEWSPLSRPRFDEILAEEVTGLPPDARKIYEDNAVSVVEQPCYRSEQYGIERVFVVARAGARLLLFDDVEDEFGIGEPDNGGVLRDWHLYGELVFALRNLGPGSPANS